MWYYEKRLEYPVKIKTPNAKLAQVILSQYGGPDGEMGASMRYLSQRYTSPNGTVSAILTDVGTEELAHLEIVATIIHQLTRGLSPEEIEKEGFAPLLCGSHGRRMAAGRGRSTLLRDGVPVYRRPAHRPVGGSGRGNEGPHHVRQHSPPGKRPGRR